jgi:hypothetical protein
VLFPYGPTKHERVQVFLQHCILHIVLLSNKQLSVLDVLLVYVSCFHYRVLRGSV